MGGGGCADVPACPPWRASATILCTQQRFKTSCVFLRHFWGCFGEPPSPLLGLSHLQPWGYTCSLSLQCRLSLHAAIEDRTLTPGLGHDEEKLSCTLSWNSTEHSHIPFSSSLHSYTACRLPVVLWFWGLEVHGPSCPTVRSSLKSLCHWPCCEGHLSPTDSSHSQLLRAVTPNILTAAKSVFKLRSYLLMPSVWADSNCWDSWYVSPAQHFQSGLDPLNTRAGLPF